MPNHTEIYKQKAEKYNELISKQNTLTQMIEKIQPFESLDIVDLGAGTGRLTTELAEKANSIVAIDASEEMLKITVERLENARFTNWKTKVSDLRKLPLQDQSTDLIVAGWSICYLGSSNNPYWKEDIHRVMEEMKRVLRSSGTIIIFETLGTGVEQPSPPDFLKPYFETLINGYSFSHDWIRLDYTFDNLNQAKELTRFFFGDDLGDQVLKENLVRLPECAGVWWLKL
ncbi:class I SAM-dependent methyltransferase [Chengkuizengella axinellae]|uniref:Class I SAM-dependent methyltransferase n=1 Tax=Chengkuizengella axinellae TaxID=3064388 RepID=A0ABT9J333_9BACL|nr:class I SAM-dependent methyltransferase [Chengkuizengella sp. 2205SS18-9]MDP5276012.1 class I SAM-dependent methyltransferase [Chengkuizengella sp. 2205SS18-9]